MSMGQMMFYGGVVLLAITLILAIIFIAVKPKYRPESPAAALPNKKKASVESNETVLLHRETELLERNKTQLLEQNETQLIERPGK